ncbi:hypothetical protein AX774_g738 [Zancudomyces culisetae]|uniref:Uncharacterized protein n=1 Tax=Zancudomyces culisetae TaxID=1213189 RepID=A0A1R1PXR6_ZANCU|nr:hypothetical protein AX774_g738 [Zancudomyces culisetae]|eukprot:OMH85708.1 hypothetical protein AX774_g738 [Zancudomyces culisetae]
MLCINYALDAVKILRWGYVSIPRTHMDWAVYMMVYWIMMALINASYITDHPDHKEIVEGRAFIFQVLARIESKFQGRGIFSETFSQINKLKAHFHELNKNIYPVPSIIANSAITEMDRNPWFILGTTASVGYLCCLMENSAEALKVLSLEHYTDYHASKPAPSFTKNTLAILSSVDITLGYIYDVFFTPTDKEISQRYKTFNSQKAFAGKNRKSTSNTLQMPNVICRPPECLWTRGSTSIFIKSFFMLIFPTIESIKYENY